MMGLKLRHRATVKALLWYTGAAAAAGSMPNAYTERARLESERAVLEHQYSSARAVCYQQFEVNRCLTDARRRQNVLLTEVKRQERLLNAEERKSKAVAQVQKLEERSGVTKGSTSAMDGEPVSREQTQRQERSITKAVEQPKAPGRNTSNGEIPSVVRGSVSDTKSVPKTRVVESEKKLIEYNKKQQDATEYREEIDKRRRDRSSPLAAPLPPLPSKP